MNNLPKVKVGIVAVSRDCFPESLSVNRRKALIEAYKAKYDPDNIYECPICIVESEIHMVQALEDVKMPLAVMHWWFIWATLVRKSLRHCSQNTLTVRRCSLRQQRRA